MTRALITGGASAVASGAEEGSEGYRFYNSIIIRWTGLFIRSNYS
jgi:hypothetical protein